MSTLSFVVTVVLGMLGVLFTYLFVGTYWLDRQIGRSATTVTGTVVEQIDSSEGTFIRASYSVDGVAYEIRSQQVCLLEVGAPVPIRYLPGRPLRAHIDTRFAERWSHTLDGLAGVVLTVGGAIATAILGTFGVF